MRKSAAKSTPQKVSVQCPHCAKTQLESAYAKSTCCRKCSRYFDIGKQPEQDATRESPVGAFFKKLSKLVSGETSRSIRCFDCGHSQVVSISAKSSLCPNCGAYIDLRDFKISTSFSRAIQTQGSVIVTSRGDLASNRIYCGRAVIEGKLQGNLSCTGTTRIKAKGRLFGGIESAHLIISKGSDVECMRPVKVEKVDVHGKMSARIIAETVTISKSGCLDGTVYAKAIRVEKGGKFHGELVIGKRELTQQELLPVEKQSRSETTSGPENEPGMLALF